DATAPPRDAGPAGRRTPAARDRRDRGGLRAGGGSETRPAGDRGLGPVALLAPDRRRPGAGRSAPGAGSRMTALASWDEMYRESRRGFLAERGEEPLQRAHELGRRAIGEQLGLLDLVTMHHRALSALLAASEGGRTPGSVAADAGLFLSEMLSSYEMVHRGFRETVLTLRRINEMLEEEARRIAHGVHDDAGQLLAAVPPAVA